MARMPVNRWFGWIAHFALMLGTTQVLGDGFTTPAAASGRTAIFEEELSSASKVIAYRAEISGAQQLRALDDSAGTSGGAQLSSASVAQLKSLIVSDGNYYNPPFVPACAYQVRFVYAFRLRERTIAWWLLASCGRVQLVDARSRSFTWAEHLRYLKPAALKALSWCNGGDAPGTTSNLVRWRSPAGCLQDYAKEAR